MLAPMTNKQSHEDGVASNAEIDWLARCAQGGFGMVQTCGASVRADGKTFEGQLGVYSDRHLDGLTRMASAIKNAGALCSIQLHHGGPRSSAALGGVAVGPSDDPRSGVRGLSTAEVEQLRDAFIEAAKRTEQAGFNGVEVHSAFGFIPALFLSPIHNRRTDRYGGSLEGRSRLLFEIIDGIRQRCGDEFQIGLRISIERYGFKLDEMRDVAAEAFRAGALDYLDLALWDAAKEVSGGGPSKGRSILSLFTQLPRFGVRLGVAGKLMGAQGAAWAINEGCDFVLIGRQAIVHHDFPNRVLKDQNYHSPSLPVSAEHLRREGLSPTFLSYMSTWPDFVK
uniref:NADH:flavin oxidoreductase/NADH oxidase n=1 Tax=Caulobacter sp. (strain K31) TaxID=366602 RepID=B0T6P7_CAUSK